jgi:hypothetical protein
VGTEEVATFVELGMGEAIADVPIEIEIPVPGTEVAEVAGLVGLDGGGAIADVDDVPIEMESPLLGSEVGVVAGFVEVECVMAIADVEEVPKEIDKPVLGSPVAEVTGFVGLDGGKTIADVDDDPIEKESPVDAGDFVGEDGTPIDRETEVGMDVGRETGGVPRPTERPVDEGVGGKVVSLMPDETVGVPIMITSVDVAGVLVETLEDVARSLSPIW